MIGGDYMDKNKTQNSIQKGVLIEDEEDWRAITVMLQEISYGLISNTNPNKVAAYHLTCAVKEINTMQPLRVYNK
jgi:hypothetical protein